MIYRFNNVYIKDKYSLLSSTKYNPIVKDSVNKMIDDYYMNEKSIEVAESKYQELTICKLYEKYPKTNLLISGDLQNQILSSTLSASEVRLPLIGIYSACSTFVEGLIIASEFCELSKINSIVSVSSHNLVSEKQFRFPVEYGAVRRKVNTCTASGSVSVYVTSEKSNIKIESALIGKVYKTNHKDTNDMGSAMAIACANSINDFLRESKRKIDYYDLVLTGDLGIYGARIMKECFEKISKQKMNNLIDSGSIFYKDKKTPFAGASGPCIIPFVLFDYIVPSKKYKKILVVGSGSLHSVISSNLKLPIPSISHVVSLEVFM